MEAGFVEIPYCLHKLNLLVKNVCVHQLLLLKKVLGALKYKKAL